LNSAGLQNIFSGFSSMRRSFWSVCGFCGWWWRHAGVEVPLLPDRGIEMQVAIRCLAKVNQFNLPHKLI